MRIKRPVRRVHTATKEPATGKLVVGRGVEPEGALETWRSIRRASDRHASGERGLILSPPDELAAGHERAIDGAAQRLPAVHGIDSVEVRDEGAAEQVVPARVG